MKPGDLLLNGNGANSVEGAGEVYTFHYDPPPLGRVIVFWDDAHQITDWLTPPGAFDATAPEAQWEYELTDAAPPQVVALQSLYRGPEWERACSMEFIPGPGQESFQVNCGIRIHGNASRNPAKTPKHSSRQFFRRDYGPGQLNQTVFPESPADSFNTLVLRGDFNNSWLHWSPAQRARGTRIRDGWAKESWRDMGHPGSHSRYFHLYINGLYWGIYDFGERIDASFAANYLGGEREDYDTMSSKPTKAVDGDRAAYDAMLSAVRFQDLTVLNNYLNAHQHLDVTNHIDYLLLNFYGGNEDWGFDSNWNAVRRRNPAGTYQ